MNNYAKGAEYERKLSKELQQAGYEVVRSAASRGSHAIDLVAIGKHQTRLIQVKSTKKRIVSTAAVANKYRKEITALQNIQCLSSVWKYLYLWTHRKGWRLYLIDGDGIHQMEDDKLYDNS